MTMLFIIIITVILINNYTDLLIGLISMVTIAGFILSAIILALVIYKWAATGELTWH